MNNAKQIRTFVCDKIRAVAAESGHAVGELGDDYNLVESGLFDSIAFVQLVDDIEQTFDLELNFDDVDPEVFTSLGGLLRCASGPADTTEGEASQNGTPSGPGDPRA